MFKREAETVTHSKYFSKFVHSYRPECGEERMSELPGFVYIRSHVTLQVKLNAKKAN